MIQAGITRSVPAEDPATSQAELARLRAEYEAELGVWRGKYQQAEVDRENSSSFEKVDFPTTTAFPFLSLWEPAEVISVQMIILSPVQSSPSMCTAIILADV